MRDEVESADGSDAVECQLFGIAGSQVALMAMPAPVPWSDLEGPCATSLLWRDAAAAVRAHDHHVIVTVFGDADPMTQSRLLTQVTAALMAVSPESIGVYWCGATLVAPKPLFIDFATDVLPKGPPWPIWIDFRVGWNEDRSASWGFTAGLAALGLMDLEAKVAKESPIELKKRFEGIAIYLMDKGLVIKDGDTLGETADEKLRVVYGPSAFGATGQVMQLRYDSTMKSAPPSEAAKKPWWKVW